MRTRSSSKRRNLTPLVLGASLWLLWPAQALASALVRFVHAVPGVGTATVDVNTGSGEQDIGSIGFGQVTPFKSVKSGQFKWTLKSTAGKALASGTSTVGDGVYDIVILDKPTGVTLGVYKSASARPGTSLVRVIHAVPELGSPMFMLDMHTLASRLPYVSATPYFALTPGEYSLSAMKPWAMKPGDPTLVDVDGVHFKSGVAYSAIAIGSRGQRVRVVRLVDRGAPLTRPVDLQNVVKPGAQSSSMMNQPSSIVVKSGDSLWSIAQQLVGSSATDEQIQQKLTAIWNMNAKRIGTGDPNLLFAGQRLMLPA
jgi:hypothetical protein